jgi:hypothetical protein
MSILRMPVRSRQPATWRSPTRASNRTPYRFGESGAHSRGPRTVMRLESVAKAPGPTDAVPRRTSRPPKLPVTRTRCDVEAALRTVVRSRTDASQVEHGSSGRATTVLKSIRSTLRR